MIRPRTASLAVAPRPSSLPFQARLALLTGGVMLASMSLSSLGLLAARADDKSDRRERQYKIGAGVLAGAALYYGIKKRNPIGATVAGAGAYYAYKKGKQEGQKSDRTRYGYNNPRPGAGGVGNSYPDDGGYPVQDPGGYGYPASAPGGYGEDYGYGADDNYPRDVDGDNYGLPTGGDYAQNGEDYPDYGLNGLRSRRDSKGRTSKSAPQNRRRITTK